MNKMAFFKKKEARELKLPELPSSEFPELPSEESQESPQQLRGLPQLPMLSQFPQLPSLPQMQAERTEKEVPFIRPMTMEIGEERRSREGPIFIKIDKFKEAMANFELVKKKLHESSSLLEKIKETREKEEEELNQWSAELSVLKDKIGSIDRKIFSTLD